VEGVVLLRCGTTKLFDAEILDYESFS